MDNQNPPVQTPPPELPTQQPSVVQTPQQIPPQPIPPKKFPLIPVILIAVILLTGALFAGLTLGTKPQPKAVTQPSPTQALRSTVPPLPSPTTASTPTAALGETVQGGGVQIFNKYSVTIPSGWTKKQEHNADIGTDKLSLSKDDALLEIYQAAAGGGLCFYPGDKTTDGPGQMFTTYTAIPNTDGEIRRGQTTSPTPGQVIYSLCQQRTAGNGYGVPTDYGFINYTFSSTPSDTLLKEMDSIVSSLKKLP